MSEETKKTNFFKNAFKSIKDLDKYEDFALELPSKAFKYFLKMIAVFCLIIAIFYTYKIVDNMKDIYTNLQSKLPDFSYAQGTLNMNSGEPIVIEDYKDTFGKIIIDTNISEDELSKYEKNTEPRILILKDRCIVISNGAMGQVTYKYSDIANQYKITGFTKQDVENYVNNMNLISLYASVYFVIFVYVFILYFISIFVDVMILSLLALIISRISRIRLKYAPSFSIAIHSITLPVLLNLIYIVVNLLTGFRIKYFQLMYNTISYIYVIVAILMIKTDFIDRQLELIKIAKEQEKIKKEMQEKEDVGADDHSCPKDDNENKRPKEKKPEEKKEKKKKEADGPIGDATCENNE